MYFVQSYLNLWSARSGGVADFELCTDAGVQVSEQSSDLPLVHGALVGGSHGKGAE